MLCIEETPESIESSFNIRYLVSLEAKISPCLDKGVALGGDFFSPEIALAKIITCAVIASAKAVLFP